MTFLLLRGAALAAFLASASSLDLRGRGAPKRGLQSGVGGGGGEEGGLLLNDDIVVDRPSALFRNELQIGSTYVQSMDMDQASKMSLGGMDVEQKMHVDMEAECAVSEVAEPVGGRQVDMTVTYLDLTVEAGGVNVEFDSDAAEDADPMLRPLANMVGKTMTVVTDRDGKVVEASDHEELMKQLGGSGAGGQGDAMKDLASPKQFDQMARMAKAVPTDQKIAPGDEWDIAEMELDGGLVLTGTGRLVGFRQHEDNAGVEHEVAVFALEGSFEMDLNKLGDALDLLGEEGEDEEEDEEAFEAAKNVQITGGRMTCTLYWDNEDNLVRWMEQTQSMVMWMPNPVDPNGDAMEIPTDQVFKMSVDKRD